MDAPRTLHVWASVLGVLLPAQVWTLANYVMDDTEAKRLFGVVEAGALRMDGRRFDHAELSRPPGNGKTCC